MGNLPGLNYNSKLNIDDLEYSATVVEQAILDRMALCFGYPALTQPRSGIVDVIDPKNLDVSETNRPLIVYSSTANPLLVNVSPGTAVCPNGAFVVVPSAVENLALKRTLAGDINVVFVENQIVESDPARKTRYNTSQKPRKIQSTNIVRVDLLSNFTNPALYPIQRIKNIVSCAVVTVVEATSTQNTTALELKFDYSNAAYDFNRPWFSVADVEHRSMIGSGTPTPTNTHGLTFNDLVSGNLTVYDQLLSTGLILAKDSDIKGTPGTSCYEVIDFHRIIEDDTGNITKESRFGGIGSRYVELANYPIKITAFYLQSHKGRAIPFDHIQGTRIVVLPYPEGKPVDQSAHFWTDFSDEPAVIQYNRVIALEPPTQILSNTLTFASPDDTRELVITGGITLTNLSNPFFDFDGSGPVPRNYTLFVNTDGSLLRSPQLIQSTVLLDDFGFSYPSAIIPVSGNYYGAAKISIGLADASSAQDMTVMIRIYGTDADGVSVSEDITFYGSSWVNVAIPGSENPKQYILTEQVFSTVTSIQIRDRYKDGPHSKIEMWAELETGITQGLDKLARTTLISWSGVAISSIRDLRKTVKSIPDQVNKYIGAADITGLGGSSLSLIACDDFSMPQYRDSTSGKQAASYAQFRIVVNDNTRLTSGDTVNFPTGKSIIAVSGTDSPNRAAGQFKIAGTNTETRDEVKKTIDLFDCGFTAEEDNDSGDNVILCTSIISGARGNGIVTQNQVNVDAIYIKSGDSSTQGNAVDGIDSFGESYIVKHQDSIDTVLPSSTTYDVSGYRKRYLTIPFPIGDKKSVVVNVFGVPLPKETNVQLRARIAYSSSPIWQPWEIVTANGSSFTIQKDEDIAKIQLEIFGKASGFALFEYI